MTASFAATTFDPAADGLLAPAVMLACPRGASG